MHINAKRSKRCERRCGGGIRLEVDLRQKLKSVYLVHSSLLHHTERAYYPKPGRNKKEKSHDYEDFASFD